MTTTTRRYITGFCGVGRHLTCAGDYRARGGALCLCECHVEPARDAGMRFAYADPPYLGCCHKYDHHHPDGLCWDDLATHRRLVDRLARDYPDGWALSCNTPSLRHVLPLCPEDVRVASWVKPFHALRKGVRPSYGWEPVIFRGGRNANHPPPEKGGKATTPRDFISAPITMRKGLTGAKPAVVCEWILDLLGHDPATDTLDDLYPGTGVMGEVVASRTVSLFASAP